MLIVESKSDDLIRLVEERLCIQVTFSKAPIVNVVSSTPLGDAPPASTTNDNLQIKFIQGSSVSVEVYAKPKQIETNPKPMPIEAGLNPLPTDLNSYQQYLHQQNLTSSHFDLPCTCFKSKNQPFFFNSKTTCTYLSPGLTISHLY